MRHMTAEIDTKQIIMFLARLLEFPEDVSKARSFFGEVVLALNPLIDAGDLWR